MLFTVKLYYNLAKEDYNRVGWVTKLKYKDATMKGDLFDYDLQTGDEIERVIEI